MGYPINSEAPDYALYELDERKGYFTSERKGENGDIKPDIYSDELPPNLYDLRVVISELGNKNEIVANAKIKVSGSDGSTFEAVTNDKGTFYWEKKPNGERFVNEDVSYNIQVDSLPFKA